MKKESIYYVVDSLGNTHQEVIEKTSEPITNLFVEGGLAGMIVITLLLIALFVAAWKAPKWVKEIGIGALVVGIFGHYGDYLRCWAYSRCLAKQVRLLYAAA